MVDNGCMGITYQIFLKKKKGGVGARHEGECDIYSAKGKTMNIWNISRIFYLCYDQSQQRSLDMRTSHKTINL